MSENGCGSRSEGRATKQKVCEACGAQFDCSAPWGPCWCEEVKVNQEKLGELRSRYADCLCPKCLNAAAAKKTVPAG